MLVDEGIEAYALHQKRGFRYRWFKSATPVRWTHQLKAGRIRNIKQQIIYWITKVKDFSKATDVPTNPIEVRPKDIVVIPETKVARVRDIFPGTSKIILNQNPFFLFQQSSLENPEQTIYHPDIKGCISMSKWTYSCHRLAQLENTWPASYFIESKLYRYSNEKKRQIAYMPRRLRKDSTAVINLLRLRGNLQGFTFVPIDGMTQQEVAQALGESLIFLSFSYREGFGLPPAEAMACGCLVVGYSGNGGDEFFDEGLAFKITNGDLASYVETVEKTIAEYVKNPVELDAYRMRASKYVLETYSKKASRDLFLTAWNNVTKNMDL